MSDKPDKDTIERAYRQVFGNPGRRSTAQEIVYNHLTRMSKKPARRHNGHICPNETIAQTAVRDHIITVLEMADSKPLEEKQKTQIRTP